jgi:Co/Zn/Cd efflux system component
MTTDDALRRTVRLVVLLNIAYFGIEFTVAVAIGSVRCSPTALISWKTPRSTS